MFSTSSILSTELLSTDTSVTFLEGQENTGSNKFSCYKFIFFHNNIVQGCVFRILMEKGAELFVNLCIFPIFSIAHCNLPDTAERSLCKVLGRHSKHCPFQQAAVCWKMTSHAQWHLCAHRLAQNMLLLLVST